MKTAIWATQRPNYGFYAIRDAYPGNMAKGLLLGISLHSLIILGYGFSYVTRPVEVLKDFTGENTLIDLSDPPPTISRISVPVVDNPPAQPIESGNPVIVDDDISNVNTTIASQDEIITHVSMISGAGDGPIAVDVIPENETLITEMEVEERPSDPPYIVMSVKPEYPVTAKLAGLEGRVFVRGLVDINGVVIKTQFVSGDALFFASASESLKCTKFKPGVNNGRPVKVWVTVPFTFRLQ